MGLFPFLNKSEFAADPAPRLEPQRNEFIDIGDRIKLRLSLWGNCAELLEQHIVGSPAMQAGLPHPKAEFELIVGGMLVEAVSPDVPRNEDRMLYGDAIPVAVSRLEIGADGDIQVRRIDGSDIFPGKRALHFHAVYDPFLPPPLGELQAVKSIPRRALDAAESSS